MPLPVLCIYINYCASRSSEDRNFTDPTGPGDIGESEGMGGLLAVANQSHHGQAEDDDVEERAERQDNIEEGGDRSDPELVAIDAFKEKMEKHDAANCDMENSCATIVRSPEEDWRKHIEEAEQLYVQDPAKVDDFLDKMRIKYLSTEEKREKLAELAHKLVDDRITAIPAQVLLDSAPCSEISCWFILRCI